MWNQCKINQFLAKFAYKTPTKSSVFYQLFLQWSYPQNWSIFLWICLWKYHKIWLFSWPIRSPDIRINSSSPHLISLCSVAHIVLHFLSWKLCLVSVIIQTIFMRKGLLTHRPTHLCGRDVAIEWLPSNFTSRRAYHQLKLQRKTKTWGSLNLAWLTKKNLLISFS